MFRVVCEIKNNEVFFRDEYSPIKVRHCCKKSYQLGSSKKNLFPSYTLVRAFYVYIFFCVEN